MKFMDLIAYLQKDLNQGNTINIRELLNINKQVFSVNL